ncbi:alkaline phosphatase D family protein [Corynebacterium resistens]|uniref:alkaline phosphatase D family protein n=1 Tax=Corynebacterium resistens TaxID=258224 RepID=UPI0023523726|nr:alkaline phosphatase D family protein [Corynebacterium resistens]
MTNSELPHASARVESHASEESANSTEPNMVSRRRALQAGATLTAAGAVASVAAQGGVAAAAPGQHKVFQHGVASGDPLPNGVLLWTRVTSRPNDYAGRGRGVKTQVKWEISPNKDFKAIVASGTVTATPDRDMTVKPDVNGLQPATSYYYRFRVIDGAYKGQVSPIGRTRTAPAAGSDVSELRFALFSCSNWEAGHFNAYRDMSMRQDLDFALHVGDYIYEYKRGEYNGKRGAVRGHLPKNEIVTLQDYRERYAQYHTDPALQAAHANCPWIVTWDDHEVANDTWAGGAENHTPGREGNFQKRRDAAIQAYLEWLPIRATPFSQGGHIYRNLSFGNLVELNMLDLRTYRNKQMSFLKAKGIDKKNRTMLGSEQFKWLAGKLTTSQAKWNLIGNSVMISPVLIPPLDPKTTAAVTQLLGLPEQGMPYNFDQWDGYAAERRRLIKLLHDRKINNTVWLTGDIHSSWANDIPVEPGTYPRSGVAGVEIVCTSVTSSNIDDILKLPEDNALSHTAEFAFQNMNKHIKYLDYDSHGYTVVRVTPEFVHADWMHMRNDGIFRRNAPLFRAKSARTYRGKGIRLHNTGINPATHAGRSGVQ